MALAATPACAFFGNEYDPCFEDPSCSTGNGGSKAVEQDLHDSGGASGGDGDSTGGSDAAGGSGSSVGNSGGNPNTGGDGSGGSAPAGRLIINEMRVGGFRFIELYNQNEQPVSLEHLSVSTGTTVPNYPGCALASATSIPAQGFLEITGGAECQGPGPCIASCSFNISIGTKVYILDAASGTQVTAVEREYVGATTGQSYGAIPDGSSNYLSVEPTPGASNK